MRLLFTLDTKDYDPAGTVLVRPSVRGIFIESGKVHMVYSKKYDYYKFPGGGIEPGESHTQTLVREAAEEAGLTILPESILPYGRVHRIQRAEGVDCFIQENYYYLCKAAPGATRQKLDDYEADAGFVPVLTRPESVIRTNRFSPHGPADQIMLEREARVLELLQREGYFSPAP